MKDFYVTNSEKGKIFIFTCSDGHTLKVWGYSTIGERLLVVMDKRDTAKMEIKKF